MLLNHFLFILVAHFFQVMNHQPQPLPIFFNIYFLLLGNILKYIQIYNFAWITPESTYVLRWVPHFFISMFSAWHKVFSFTWELEKIVTLPPKLINPKFPKKYPVVTFQIPHSLIRGKTVLKNPVCQHICFTHRLRNTAILVNALVTSYLNFCNHLLNGLPHWALHTFQWVQHSAGLFFDPTCPSFDYNFKEACTFRFLIHMSFGHRFFSFFSYVICVFNAD